MSVLRTICCDVCKQKQTEESESKGWPGWGAVQGIALNGIANPSLCPEHLSKVAELIDGLANGLDKS